MSNLPLNLVTATGGVLKKTTITKYVSGAGRTVTFDIASEIPNRYHGLTVNQFACGFSRLHTGSTVAVTVGDIQYDSTTGILSVPLSIPSGYTFHGDITLSIIY